LGQHKTKRVDHQPHTPTDEQKEKRKTREKIISNGEDTYVRREKERVAKLGGKSDGGSPFQREPWLRLL